MNCFGNYQKLDDMKNLLKVRIKNHGEEVPCYLYKYYFDYLLKIAKMFRVMDEDMLPLKLL